MAILTETWEVFNPNLTSDELRRVWNTPSKTADYPVGNTGAVLVVKVLDEVKSAENGTSYPLAAHIKQPDNSISQQAGSIPPNVRFRLVEGKVVQVYSDTYL